MMSNGAGVVVFGVLAFWRLAFLGGGKEWRARFRHRTKH